MTVLKYPGSKQSISQSIISLFPSEYRKMTYLEPFFGSGAVFFNKARSKIETINDMDSDVYNFFLQLRDSPEELARLIELTPWHREEFRKAYEKTDNDLENARRFLVRYWFSIGARPYTMTGFRMLQPSELAAAQGFPMNYIFTGNKTEQVKQIGNAVPPDFARSLYENILKNMRS